MIINNILLCGELLMKIKNLSDSVWKKINKASKYAFDTYVSTLSNKLEKQLDNEDNIA